MEAAQAESSAKILVVKNINTNSTFIDTSTLWKNAPNPRMIHEDIRSRDWVVKQGMLAAREYANTKHDQTAD